MYKSHTYVNTITMYLSGYAHKVKNNTEGALYSRNMGKSDLPDIHTLSPRACGCRGSGVYIRHLKPKGSRPRAEGIYMSQTMSAHATTIVCHLVIGYKPTYITHNSSKH